MQNACTLKVLCVVSSVSRPGTSTSKSDRPRSKTVSASLGDYSEESDEEEEGASQSSLSKLSDERGDFTPTEEPLSPVLSQN